MPKCDKRSISKSQILSQRNGISNPQCQDDMLRKSEYIIKKFRRQFTPQTHFLFHINITNGQRRSIENVTKLSTYLRIQRRESFEADIIVSVKCVGIFW